MEALDDGYDEALLLDVDGFVADEAFFTGTAAEVTPIRELDRRQIDAGKRGPITTKLQSLFFDTVNGRIPAYADWLTLVT